MINKRQWLVILSLLLSLALLLSGCNVKTKDEVKGTDAAVQSGGEGKTDSGAAQTVDHKPVDVRLLAMSYYEKDVNVLRDLLAKAGFNPIVNIQPDYSSWSAQVEAGNFDLSLGGWNTVTGNPDYAVRSLFRSDGDYNIGINDPKIDELIDLAATQTPEEYVETYKKFEDLLVTENAYIIPFFSGYNFTAVNKNLIKPESFYLEGDDAGGWERVEFVKAEDNANQPYVVSQQLKDLTSLDPIKANDGSINMLNSNMYIRLVNLTREDKVVPSGTLCYQFAIAEGNNKFYFLLRDDVNFTKVENKEAVDSGIRVGAEDVVFSLNRAKDKNSVPDHRTYTLHSSIKEVSIVTDMAVLDGKTAGGESLRQALEAQAPAAIQALSADKNDVDNQNGRYQLVCIETLTPFPQVLNFLAHQSAGIVSQEQVEKINSFKVEDYDREKDIAYGDSRTITAGEGYNNQLMASGPYVLVEKDDYQIVFKKNPVFMKGQKGEPRINTVIVKFIADADSNLAAFRNSEIHVGSNIPVDKLSILENDPNFVLKKYPSNGVSYASFNFKTSDFADVNLRKAALYAVDQEAFITVYNGLKRRTYSTVSPMVDTGNVLEADPQKVQEYLAKYFENHP